MNHFQPHSFIQYNPMNDSAIIALPSSRTWKIEKVTSASLHRLFVLAQSADVRIHKMENGDIALHHEGWNLFYTGSSYTMLPDSLLGCSDYRWTWVIQNACHDGCVKAKEMLQH